MKGQQPRHGRRWDKALPEASPPSCAESITTSWLNQPPLLVLPLKTLRIPRYADLCSPGPVSALFQPQPPICMDNGAFPGLVHQAMTLSCQLLVSTPRHTSSSNMPTLASKDSLELTLSVRTPDAHGAGQVSMDVVGKPTGCSASGPKPMGRSQCCVPPRRQEHTTLHSSPPGDILATPADSATPLPPRAQERLAIAACRGRELPALL